MFTRRLMGARRSAVALSVLLVVACAGPGRMDERPTAQRVAALMPADVIVLGEQHDAAAHHAIEHESVQALLAARQLAALVLEMAEAGRSTARLPPQATEAQVRAALGWDAAAWPWADYGPAVMAAVRAGVPVLGANLPRARMRDAMADVSLDAQLGEDARRAQQASVREGHCGLLPEDRIGAMTRVQIARDRSMAQVVAAQARGPGQAVLLITGAGHALRSRGVPQHLPTDLRVASVWLRAGAGAMPAQEFDRIWPTPALPPQDHCASLRDKAPRPAS